MGQKGPRQPGAHGLSEVLYAFSSAGNNNGSAFGGLSVNTPEYNSALGVAMLFARYWVAVPRSPWPGRSPGRSRPVGQGRCPRTPAVRGAARRDGAARRALTFVPRWLSVPSSTPDHDWRRTMTAST